MLTGPVQKLVRPAALSREVAAGASAQPIAGRLAGRGDRTGYGEFTCQRASAIPLPSTALRIRQGQACRCKVRQRKWPAGRRAGDGDSHPRRPGGLRGAGCPDKLVPGWKTFRVAADKQAPGLLIGPVSALAKMCTEDLAAGVPGVQGQRPPPGDATADEQWVRGCEAGYHQDYPDQLVEYGMMFGSGTQACAGACGARWYAAGKSLSDAAGEMVGFSSGSGGARSAAANWCADIMFPARADSWPAAISAQLQANMPPEGPATLEWEKGCEAAFNVGTAAQGAQATRAAKPSAAAQPPAPAKQTPAPAPTTAASMSSADYQGLYQNAYQETTDDHHSGQTPATYKESDSEFCLTTIEPSLGSEDPVYAGCMAALSAQH